MFNLLCKARYRNHGECQTWWRGHTIAECNCIICAMLNMRKQWPALSETEFEFTLVPVS